MLYYGVGHPESVQRARAIWEVLCAAQPTASTWLDFCFIGESSVEVAQDRPGWSVQSPPPECRQKPEVLALWMRNLLADLASERSLVLVDTFPNGREHELEPDGLESFRTVWLATHLSGEWSTHLVQRGWPLQSCQEVLWCENATAPSWLCQMALHQEVGVQNFGPVLDFEQRGLLSRQEARKWLGLREGDFAVACIAYPTIDHRRRVASALRQFGEVWRGELAKGASDPRNELRFFWNSGFSTSPCETACLRGYDLFLGHFDYQYAYRIAPLLTPSIGYLEPNDPTGSRERLVSLGYLRRPQQRLVTTELASVAAFREIVSSSRSTRHAKVAGSTHSLYASVSQGGAERVSAFLLSRLLGPSS